MAQYTSYLYLAVIVVAFYFLLIRPQQKRTKEHNAMISAIEPGTEIVTIGGIYGTIVSIGEGRIRIRVADGTELEISKRAVGSIVPATDASACVTSDTEDAAETGDEDAPNA